MADFYERAIEKAPKHPWIIWTWTTQQIRKELNQRGIPLKDLPISVEHFVDIINRVIDGSISHSTGCTVLTMVIDKGKSPEQVIREQGLAQVSDASALERAVDAVIKQSPKEVEQFRAGKEGVINFLMGMVMKETKGKANPQMVRELLQKKLAQ